MRFDMGIYGTFRAIAQSESSVLSPIHSALLGSLLAFAPASAASAIFDDGNDRALIHDLIEREKSGLTDEEKAILVAANRIGVFALCEGEISGNAFLIRYNGRPAIVTNAHMFIDDDGTMTACSGRMEDGSAYMPNIAWYDSQAPDRDKGFVSREVKLVLPPANWSDMRATFQGAASRITSEHDVAVFYLEEDVSTDTMPDGSMRGYLKASDTTNIDGKLYMMGYALDIENGLMPIYQKRCPGGRLHGPLIIGNTCDVVIGSSGSLLAVMEEGELKFRGIQSSAFIETLGTDHAADVEMLNYATSSTRLRQMDKLD